MLMKMGNDWNLLMSQATALDSESRAARAAWNIAADAASQAKLGLAKAPADPVLQQTFQLAREDEGRKQKHYWQIQERLAKHRADRRAFIDMLCTPSEPSAPLIYQRLTECH